MISLKSATTIRFALAAAAVAVCSPVEAQPHGGQSSDTLSLYVPAHAGRGAAVVATAIAPALSRALGRSVTILSGDAPDAPHFHVDSSQSLGHFTKTRTDSRSIPVALIGTSPMVLFGRRDLDVDDGADAMSLLRANAEKLAFGVDAPGSDADGCMRALSLATGVKITIKPNAVAGDLADMTSALSCASAPAAHTSVHTGGVRGLVVAADERVTSLWDIAAAPEAGVPLFSATAWFGIAATAEMPAADIERVNAAIQTLFADDLTIQKLADIGVSPVATTHRSSTAYRAFLDGETQRLTTLFAD